MESVDLIAIKDLGPRVIYELAPGETHVPTRIVLQTATTAVALYGPARATKAAGHTGMNSAVTALIAGERTTVKTKAWLRGLTLAANEAAKALAWGSVLVGQASQDNEYGDISIWLGSGDYGKDHEKQILDAMGLSENLGEAEVTPVAVSPTTHLPEHVEFPPKQPEMEVLIGLLSELDEIHAFRVVDLIGKGGLTVHFLVGHLKGEGHTPGWAGLVGIEAEVK